MEVQSHAPGTFCWLDLETPDSAGAKRFYGELFGWSFIDFPMGEKGVYTMCQKSGKDVGALYQDQKPGVPPHWTAYVSVASADESAQKAGQLGGNVMAGAFDVMDVGRLAVVQDPTGAILCVWEPRRHHGFALQQEPGTYCWAELNTRDTENAKAFYTGLFGWGIKPNPEYSEFTNGGKGIAGMMAIQPQWGDVPPNWLIYFAVEKCDPAVEKATSLGASVIVPGTDVPNVGRFSVLRDPQGAVFGIVD